MLSAMMLCISFMQQKNKWEWNWRIETNVDDRKKGLSNLPILNNT